MSDEVVIEPMREDFLLWRCLHSGPVSRETVDLPPADPALPWPSYRARNLPLLLKLTRAYGACAVAARLGDRIVGHLRFYPRQILDMNGGRGLCLQQDAPCGPSEDLAERDFPPLAEMTDRTLVVHCLMMGSPRLKENPHQRKGLGSRMVRALIEWAANQGWDAIEANAFEDLPVVYEITGCAGRAFWEKLGFALVSREPHPDLRERHPFVLTLEAQAAAAGIAPERARDRLVMRRRLREPAEPLRS